MQEAEVRPLEAPYRPGAQGLHALAPPALYVPGPHRITVLLVDPGGQPYPAVHGPVQVGDVAPGFVP